MAETVSQTKDKHACFVRYLKSINTFFEKYDDYHEAICLKTNKQKTNKQTKPNQTKPNQTKPNKPNQTKPNQTKPNQTKQNKTKQNKTKQNKTNKQKIRVPRFLSYLYKNTQY